MDMHNEKAAEAYPWQTLGSECNAGSLGEEKRERQENEEPEIEDREPQRESKPGDG